MSSYTGPHTYPDVPALIDRVIAGEHVLITRDGQVVAELVPAKDELTESSDRAPVSHEALRELLEARDALPPLGMSSVEFLHSMHEEARD